MVASTDSCPFVQLQHLVHLKEEGLQQELPVHFRAVLYLMSRSKSNVNSVRTSPKSNPCEQSACQNLTKSESKAFAFKFKVKPCSRVPKKPHLTAVKFKSSFKTHF